MIRAELASGETLQFPDDTPDAMVEHMVRNHIQAKRDAAALERNTEALNNLARAMVDLAVAYREPREIKVKRDFADEKVVGATSEVITKH